MRFICLFIFLLFFCACASAEPYCIQTDQMAALISADGREIIPVGEYQRMECLKDGMLYAAGNEKGFRLVDAGGRFAGAVRFDSAYVSGDVVIYRQKDRYGALSAKGEPLVEVVYTQLIANGEGGYLAVTSDPYDDEADAVWYIGNAGMIPVRAESETLSGLKPFSDGCTPVMTAEGRFRYIDASGSYLSDESWLWASEFEDGIAIARGEEGVCLIRPDGTHITESRYQRIERGTGIFAALNMENRLTVLDGTGEKILYELDAEGKSFRVFGGFVALCDDASGRVFNADGECVLKASGLASFQDGGDGCIIVRDGEWGSGSVRLIGPDGVQIGESYQQITPLGSGLYSYMVMSGTEYFSDVLDKQRVSWNYDSVRYGLLDARGREILPAVCTGITLFGADRLLLESEDGVFFTDLDMTPLQSWLG